MSQKSNLLVVLLVVPLLLSLASVWVLDHAKPQKSLFTATNMIGPTAASLLHGRGLTICTEEMGTPGNPICFHAAHMPIMATVMALGIRLFGDSYLHVAIFKTILLLLPLELAILLVSMSLPRTGWKKAAIVLLLLLPFSVSAFLADTANMLVEEGYSYSFLALAVALLFFWPERAVSNTAGKWAWPTLFALVLDALYLSKSAMLAAVIVLTMGYLLVETRKPQRLLVIFLVALAPLGWTIYQHHASGSFSLGTSLDGINLHKGNNPDFLAHYPPAPGDSLDRFDPDLNRGLHFSDEWSFNDYHQNAALSYILSHPYRTLQGGLRKLYVIFLSIRKYGSTEDLGIVRIVVITGLTIFRLILWTAILGAASTILRSRSRDADTPYPASNLRTTAWIFLALVTACVLPFLVGFAYTRHVSVLIYPATLMCCRMISDGPGPDLPWHEKTRR